MSVFEGVAAESYDALQAGKDYAAECALIQDAFRRHAQPPCHTVGALARRGCSRGAPSTPVCVRRWAVHEQQLR